MPNMPPAAPNSRDANEKSELSPQMDGMKAPIVEPTMAPSHTNCFCIEPVYGRNSEPPEINPRVTGLEVEARKDLWPQQHDDRDKHEPEWPELPNSLEMAHGNLSESV
jgi:hypothetical protein